LGFSGAGQNVAVAFTTLKDFKDRTSTATEMTNTVNATMAHSKEGATMAVLPPAIDELGTFSGFSLRLQDRANLGMPALLAAQDQLMEMAAKNKKFYMVWNEGLPQGDNISLKIDRAKLNVLGVKFSDVSDIISTSMGSMYINDFPNQGRMQQVIVQVDAKSRMQLKDILNLKVGFKWAIGFFIGSGHTAME
jgi:multidrug efflux pump